MSRENVEFVERLFAAAAGMDEQTLLDALPQLIAQACDPEIEWIEAPWRADARIRRGHAGVRESFEQWLEHFEQYSFQIEEIVDCGDDVFVDVRELGQGSASGAAVSIHTYTVLTIRDGKLLRYREFNDEQAARQAAGLSD